MASREKPFLLTTSPHRKKHIRGSKGNALVSLIIAIPILLMFVFWGGRLGLRTSDQGYTSAVFDILSLRSGPPAMVYADGIAFPLHPNVAGTVYAPKGTVEQAANNLQVFIDDQFGAGRCKGVVALFGYDFNRYHVGTDQQISDADYLGSTFYSAQYCKPGGLFENRPLASMSFGGVNPPAQFSAVGELKLRADAIADRCPLVETLGAPCHTSCVQQYCTCIRLECASNMPGASDAPFDSCSCRELTAGRAAAAGSRVGALR